MIGFANMMEKELSKYPQVHIETTHTIHDGVYTRTILIPKGVTIVGSHIKIPTTLICYGHLDIYFKDGIEKVQGFRQFECEADRKQVMEAKEDSYVTMLFATKAKTAEEAEEEFTNEYDKLISRKEKR